LIFTISSCKQPDLQSTNESKQREKKLKILTTIAPLYSFTVNITGNLAQVDNLLPSGAGPHEYAFSPADIKKIMESDILIKNGINLESWLDNVIESSGKEKLTIVDTSSGTEIINNDPHIWLSPKNAVTQVRNISRALIKEAPEHGETYMENAENYILRLNALDQEIYKEIKNWERKEFVAFHSAFLYFARDYGLKQAAIIQESPEKIPSPKHIADVINTIKAQGINAIFSEPRVSHKIVTSIAKDLNLQVYTLDPMETGAFYPAWYEDTMRANLSVLKKVLNTP
jgi:ABC-type Zn uptake system ZnuABC Zn-binding protein ZnuA